MAHVESASAVGGGPSPESRKLRINPIVVRHTLEEAQSRGLDVASLLDGLGFAFDDLSDPACRVTSMRRYEEAFQCPMHFSCLENRMVFDNSVGAFEVATADPAIRLLATTAIARDGSLDDGGGNMRASVEEVLRASWLAKPTQADVARSLGIQERSLRRRLKEEGCHFQDIRDLMRRTRALEQLVLGCRPAADIAADAGFANLHGLARAFRRWTGCSLSEAMKMTRSA
jgi:AraC-like DNA-binding protein